MSLDLFAGIRVSDYEAAKPWYERLFGSEPSFEPHETECVWELAEHRFVYIHEKPEAAGKSVVTIVMEELDPIVADISSRGIEPYDRETYPGKASKAIYRDADGNEISYASSAE